MPYSVEYGNSFQVLLSGVPDLTHTSGNDIGQTGQRRWGIEDRSHDAEYMGFVTGEPAHENIEHCYTMYRYTNWLMYDYPCSFQTNFHICEL